MRLLGIDWGERWLGLAWGEDGYVQPLKVIKVSSKQDALQKLSEVVREIRPQGIVVGISEGASAQKATQFARYIKKMLKSKVFLVDETLTTKDAEVIKKRHRTKLKRADALAAALILQNYWLNQKEGGENV